MIFLVGGRPALAMALCGLLLAAGCRCGTTHKTSSGGTTPADGTVASSEGRGPAGTWAGTALRCVGLPANCGPAGNEVCCTSLRVPGGTFARSYDGVDFLDKSFPATVSDFYQVGVHLRHHHVAQLRVRTRLAGVAGAREATRLQGAATLGPQRIEASMSSILWRKTLRGN
jgi:hypothetical protein